MLAYLRVSTAKQADSGAGLQAQRSALQAEADRQGWDLEYVEDAGYSAKDLNRPALTGALARLNAREVDVLLVAKLARLSRSVHDLSGLVKGATRRGWSVVCLDVGVDTSTPNGKFMATVTAGIAELERELIGQRTRDALAAKKAAGVRLGRPPVLPGSVVRRIVEEPEAGRSWQTIADGLTADGVPTARGGATWTFSSARAVYRSQAAAGLTASQF
ncbi:recombinase family protein [Kineococcus radiotolerans]|uniref:Resolvase domain n=1 Tax=Kineococcus radiotolerans (strain ATCC BAA-149 / DSM 14245 / SRS30216) TaxID=266940 RepID=A6WG98_KINRD|nr:recombinase family protein [Kineococcus radiotolerans]ABS05837.1 Resolvase domain [Kineococcus radiotolerans SRS30216 = ATCC BAA-149]